QRTGRDGCHWNSWCGNLPPVIEPEGVLIVRRRRELWIGMRRVLDCCSERTVATGVTEPPASVGLPTKGDEVRCKHWTDEEVRSIRSLRHEALGMVERLHVRLGRVHLRNLHGGVER